MNKRIRSKEQDQSKAAKASFSIKQNLHPDSQLSNPKSKTNRLITLKVQILKVKILDFTRSLRIRLINNPKVQVLPVQGSGLAIFAMGATYRQQKGNDFIV